MNCIVNVHVLFDQSFWAYYMYLLFILSAKYNTTYDHNSEVEKLKIVSCCATLETYGTKLKYICIIESRTTISSKTLGIVQFSQIHLFAQSIHIISALLEL